MAITPLRNKKTGEIKRLDESYLRVFPKAWELATKQAPKSASTSAPSVVKADEKKEGKNA